ncbi:MAG: Tm-1-like ATP-binding domain-containing protein [Rubrivivax sp.]
MPIATAYVVGTFDTKGAELHHVAGLLRERGLKVVSVDVGTRGLTPGVDVGAREVASHHPGGVDAVLGSHDRGRSVTAMSEALCRFIAQRDDIRGMLALGGSGGTAVVTPAMRSLPIGVPKVMVSTMASGDTAPYVDVSDITMVFPVTDIAGLNRISRMVLGNAAHALAGMLLHPVIQEHDEKPALALSMFGVTTPCVEQVRQRLRDDFDCQVFHANGSGGRALEALARAGLFAGVLDLTTTEAVDHLFGGVCTAGADRFEAAVHSGLPWVGSCGALDMVNFGAPDSVPERYRGRLLHHHNATVTLMRTSTDEMQQAGRWIAEKLNRSSGPVCWLIPHGGVSALDAPGQPFHDPVADAALFDAIEQAFKPSADHRLLRLKHHINDAAFADVVAQETRRLIPLSAPPSTRTTRRQT